MTATTKASEPEGATDSAGPVGVDTAQTVAGTQRIGVVRPTTAGSGERFCARFGDWGANWYGESLTLRTENGTVQLSPRAGVGRCLSDRRRTVRAGITDRPELTCPVPPRRDVFEADTPEDSRPVDE